MSGISFSHQFHTSDARVKSRSCTILQRPVQDSQLLQPNGICKLMHVATCYNVLQGQSKVFQGQAANSNSLRNSSSCRGPGAAVKDFLGATWVAQYLKNPLPLPAGSSPPVERLRLRRSKGTGRPLSCGKESAASANQIS